MNVLVIVSVIPTTARVRTPTPATAAKPSMAVLTSTARTAGAPTTAWVSHS